MGRRAQPKQFVEFFAGIGLVHEALRASGWDCTYANDIDPKKESMYLGHFGKSPYFHLEDIWETESIVDRIPGKPTLATASFPCTDLSLAGHGKGFDGAHSSTYFGFVQAIKAMGVRKPPLVMLENVMGFITSKSGSDFRQATQALADLGYWLDSFVLDAKSFVPQSRKRVFVIGFHESLKMPTLVRQDQSHQFGSEWRSRIEAAGSLRPPSLIRLMESTELSTGWATLPLSSPPQTEYKLQDVIDTDKRQDWWDLEATEKHYAMLSDLHLTEVERRKASGGLHVGTVYRRCRHDEMRAEVRFDNLAGCLRTPRGGSARQIVIVIDDGTVRFRWMSPREYARLQGVPEFTLAQNTIQSLFGFGDAVCVPAIEWIDKNILTPAYKAAVTPAANAKPVAIR